MRLTERGEVLLFYHSYLTFLSSTGFPTPLPAPRSLNRTYLMTPLIEFLPGNVKPRGQILDLRCEVTSDFVGLLTFIRVRLDLDINFTAD